MLSRQELLKIIGQQRNDVVARAVRGMLGILTPFYRLAVGIRNRRFDKAIARDNRNVVKRCGVPIISVGNLTTGGTGKSPMVIWLTRHLQQHGQRVVILSRGYQRLNAAGHEKSACNESTDLIAGNQNDEALEMESRLPGVAHLQDPDRFRNSRIAVEQLDANVIVLDDGFQHRQLHRDLDIVLIDATNPFGYDRLLPRGLLREPTSALKRASLIVVTRCELASEKQLASIEQKISVCAPYVPIAFAETHPAGFINNDGQSPRLSHLTNQQVFAFCGIGNPVGFFATLDRLGLEVVGQKTFPDHHHFQATDLRDINELALQAGAAAIVCTHKDWVKVGRSWPGDLPAFALLVDIQFRSGQKILNELIQRTISRSNGDLAS